jgi:four helix bundle protein
MGKDITGFRDLIAWQRAYALCKVIYQTTASFPAEEKFGLVTQMRRGAVSVPSNIAEGYGRGSRADYVRFLKVARGALYELDTQVGLSIDLGFLGSERAESVRGALIETNQVLAGLIRSLDTST